MGFGIAGSPRYSPVCSKGIPLQRELVTCSSSFCSSRGSLCNQGLPIADGTQSHGELAERRSHGEPVTTLLMRSPATASAKHRGSSDEQPKPQLCERPVAVGRAKAGGEHQQQSRIWSPL